MNGRIMNNLIVIENGMLSTYQLDDKNVWEVGRTCKDNVPDIKFHSSTVSRKHGRFQNMDGVWFYIDGNGKNGTVYNDKKIKRGIRGRVKPIALNDGDVFVFGGGEEAIINSKTIWAMFSKYSYGDEWRVADTKGMSKLTLFDGNNANVFINPAKGMIVKLDSGIAIYMGDITYLSGKLTIMDNN
ncbi:MAG: FHA domain-containing protein [Lachnospiraceae bacterium]|nr:FHA domain-containing protein [Lachnospiraceae bacterium]